MSTGAELLQKIKKNKGSLVSETKDKLSKAIRESKQLLVCEKTYGDYSDGAIKEIVDYFESKSDKMAAVACTGVRDGMGSYSGVRWTLTVHPHQDDEKSLEDIMEIDNGDLFRLATLIFYFHHEPNKSTFAEDNFLCYIFNKVNKANTNGNDRFFFAFYSNQKNRKVDPDPSKCDLYVKEFAVYQVCQKYKALINSNIKKNEVPRQEIMIWFAYLVHNKVERDRTKKFMRFFFGIEDISEEHLSKMIADAYAGVQETKKQEVFDETKSPQATEVSSVDSELAEPCMAPAPKADDQMHQLVGFFENLLRPTPYAFNYRFDAKTNQFHFEKAASVGTAEASAPSQKKHKADDAGFVLAGGQSDEDEYAT